MTGQALELREAVQGAVAQFRDPLFEEQVALAVPENVTPQRLLRAAATAVLEDEKLAKPALRASLIKAVLKSAQDGLLPDGRESALVIFGNEVVYMPMIGGFRKIAAEHGWSLSAQVVYENDEFEHRPFEQPAIVHHPVRPGRERGEAIAAYARARHRDGREAEPKMMTKADIERVREASRGKNGDLWTKWWDRAWEKTVARALFKELPLDPADARVGRVMSADDLAPNGAVAAIYGPERPALPQAPGAGAGQQTQAAAPAAPGSSLPPDPAPPSDEPPLTGEIVEWDSDELAALREVKVPDGAMAQGLTLEQVAGNEGGRDWLVWAAGDDSFTDEFREQVTRFLELRAS